MDTPIPASRRRRLLALLSALPGAILGAGQSPEAGAASAAPASGQGAMFRGAFNRAAEEARERMAP